MPPKIDLLNQVFGYRTVIRYIGSVGGRTMWECRCVCGEIQAVDAWTLRTGNANSCGCVREPNQTVTRRGKAASKTHCKQGHALIPENIYTLKSGIICRQCEQERVRKRRTKS